MVEGRDFRPEHDHARCLACTVCQGLCPATRYPEYRADEGTRRAAIYAAGCGPDAPSAHPPCQGTCPLGQDVRGYVGALADGDVETALAIITATNPLPVICGRLCLRACMRTCVRGGMDDPVAIRNLKRFAAEEMIRRRGGPRPVGGPTRVARDVVVVGAGPAGLSAAAALAREGLGVTLLEARDAAGGRLRASSGAPAEATVPDDLLDDEIQAVLEGGVALRTGVTLGRQVTLERLRDDHRAVVLALGSSWDREAVPGAAVGPLGTLVVDGRRRVPGLDGVRAAGEITSGPRNVVEVIAAGLAVARDVVAGLKREAP